MLILEEHDLDGFIKEVVKELEGEEANARKKKDTIKLKRIIANSIKDQVDLLGIFQEYTKEMFDALTSMFEGNNINGRMTMNNHLKCVKIHKT